VIAGPGDEIPVPTAGSGQLRASHADRERVIGTLKTAFVQGRLTEDELGARVDQVYASRTYAELDALTADVPAADISAAPAVATPARHRRPLVRAVAGSGGCAVVAFAALRIFDVIETEPWTGPGDGPYHSLLLVLLVAAVAAVVAALFILGYGVGTSVEMRRSRRRLPLRPGPGHALEARLHDGTSHDPGPPGPRTDQTRADLRAHTSSRYRWSSPGPAARVPHGMRAARDAILRASLWKRRAEMPARAPAQARPPVERRTAPRRDLHLDHTRRTHLHHRTHRIPDLS
jgi:DUF1707 SHOCT-like domain